MERNPQVSERQSSRHSTFLAILPSFIRAMEEQAPCGLQAGANLYRFADDDPTNETDPSGLQAAAFEFKSGDAVPDADLKNNTFPFGDGMGTVSVWIHAKGGYKGGTQFENGIYMQFKSTKTSVADVHWLQFIYRERIDATTGMSVVQEAPYRTALGNKPALRYQKTGKDNVYVDIKGVANGTDPYYDSSMGAPAVRDNLSIGIYDAPTPHQVTTFSKTTFVAETFLIDDKSKKVLYVVMWSIVSTYDTCTKKWNDEMTAKGEQVDRLPAYVKTQPSNGKVFLAGYRAEGAKPEDEIRFLNPFRNGDVQGIPKK